MKEVLDTEILNFSKYAKALFCCFIDGCETQPFKQHIKAFFALPLGRIPLHQKTMMYNISGAHKEALFGYLAHLSSYAHLHPYWKKAYAHNRKMAHITFTDPEESKQFERAVF